MTGWYYTISSAKMQGVFQKKLRQQDLFWGAGAGSIFRARRGACPAGRRLTVPSRNPQGGGLPFLSPAAPDFSFDFAPIPPAPFPSGEGGDFLVFLCKGLRPLHPPEPNPSGMGTEQRILRRASACSRRHRLTRHRRQPNVACSCLVGSSRPRCPRRSRGQSARMPRLLIVSPRFPFPYRS